MHAGTGLLVILALLVAAAVVVIAFLYVFWDFDSEVVEGISSEEGALDLPPPPPPPGVTGSIVGFDGITGFAVHPVYTDFAIPLDDFVVDSKVRRFT
jgi:hypothetical protein